MPGFTVRVLELLPGLAEHHCAATRPGGLVAEMVRGTYLGHVIEHMALELSHLIGREVYFGRTLWAGTPGLFTLILECPEDEWPGDPVAEQLLELAPRLVRETICWIRPRKSMTPTWLPPGYKQTFWDAA